MPLRLASVAQDGPSDGRHQERPRAIQKLCHLQRARLVPSKRQMVAPTCPYRRLRVSALPLEKLDMLEGLA